MRDFAALLRFDTMSQAITIEGSDGFCGSIFSSVDQ